MWNFLLLLLFWLLCSSLSTQWEVGFESWLETELWYSHKVVHKCITEGNFIIVSLSLRCVCNFSINIFCRWALGILTSIWEYKDWYHEIKYVTFSSVFCLHRMRLAIVFLGVMWTWKLLMKTSTSSLKEWMEWLGKLENHSNAISFKVLGKSLAKSLIKDKITT